MTLWSLNKYRKTEPRCDPAHEVFAEFESVGLEIADNQILADITVTLQEHRIGIIGLNGSGKSSFVRLLNGLRQPTNGTLRLFGADAPKVQAELPRHIGFVFQNPDHQAIFPTVEEEIAFGLTQLGLGKQDSRGKAQAFLKEHGCEQLAAKPIAELSEGQKQLVCILSVLVMNPAILVLDEPMTSLDALAGRSIFAKLMALPQKIVMISHDMRHFEEFDRVIWFDKGRIKMDGKARDVLRAYAQEIDRRAEDRLQVSAL